MTVQRLLRSIILLWMSSAPLLAVAHASERPNIVLIMADDIGVEGIGCYGGTSYPTPALDRLAQEGMRFTHAYAQPLCTNTRVQLMTGRYNNRNWRYFGVLDPQAKTIGHYMRDAGYRTCMAGKWQLQSYDPPSYPGAHLRRGKGMQVGDAGFDEYSLFHAWHTEEKGSRYAAPTIFENGKLLKQPRGKYGPDHWVDFIKGFIDQQKGGNKPFFVYYAMALPHRPFVPTPRSEDWSKNIADEDEDTQYFADMVKYMDHCVGRVVDHIDQSALGRETLVIFYSDNGTHQKITSQTKTGPVTGGKGRTTDAGTHVPLLVRWTGKIDPGRNDNLVDSTDFLPTIAEAAGRPVSDAVGLDGISFFPQLFGETKQTRPWVFCHYDPRPGWDKDQFRKIRFARDERYKLYGDGKLYDVPNDRLEQRPILPNDDNEISKEARTRLAAVLNEMPNPDPEPRDGDPSQLQQRLYVAAGDRMSVFAIDKANGQLSSMQELDLKGAGPFTFAPNRKRMYAVAGPSPGGSSSLATLEIDANGELKLAHQAPVNLRPGYLMTDNNGEFLAGNHYREGKASIWEIDPIYRGRTLSELSFEKNAHSTVFSPDNHWLLVPATGPNKVFVNHFTAQTGRTEPNEPSFVPGPTEVNDAKQPRHLIFHSNLSVAYTTNERELPGVGVWQWDTEKGILAPIQNMVTKPEGFQGTITTADLHLTPNARFLYVSNRDISQRGAPTGEDSIVGFHVDPQTGTLEQIGHTPCERVPRSFTIDKLGKFLYVAGQGDGKLGAYQIEESGSLTKIGQYEVGSRPIWVETSLVPEDLPNRVSDSSVSATSPVVFRATQQDEMVPPSSKLELLWGEVQFTEGPTVTPEGAVLFTDVRRSQIMRLDPDTLKVTVFRNN
ncbi:MAG: sulfatase-like hydrolase/transferase, partial [Planctomycetota bacterium]